MSLSKINNFANDDTDILAVQTTVDALYQNSYSLTEYDSTTVPAIAAGSKIEVNGSLYRASSEEAISTTDPVTSAAVADGTVYICMIPSGDASTCTAAFTATAPTWSDSKQGWYGTGDQANYKYIGGCYLDTGAYTGKYGYSHFSREYKNKSLVLIGKTGTQTFSSDTQKIQMNSETIDINGDYDPATNYRFTCRYEGAHEIIFTASPIWSASNRMYIAAYIYVNGTGVDDGHDIYFHDASAYVGGASLKACALLYLYPGDYVEIYAVVNGTTSASFTTNCRLSIKQI